MEIAALVGSWLDDAKDIYPDGFTVRTFGLALEIEQPSEEEGGLPWAEIGYTCSDSRPWVQGWPL